MYIKRKPAKAQKAKPHHRNKSAQLMYIDRLLGARAA